MSELRLETWILPAADLGRENPLAPLAAPLDPKTRPAVDKSVPPADGARIGWGRTDDVLPYRMLDGYDRVRKPRPFRVAVLENDRLRATFFPELGGRLWSLVHRSSGRELLARNPVFQPANLAIRNAWFSGGVEWNIGRIGHCPFTCDPLFAARVERPDGTPVLRMWEWERLRGVPFQIDAWLPDGSAALFVRVAIHNPHDAVVPMYWWSNIAVPQAAGTRVLVPARQAYTMRGSAPPTVHARSVPGDGGDDLTFPSRHGSSCDYFFRVPDQQRPWVAAVDEHGCGVFQTSTSRLQGRKLFRWGTHTGGRNWQRFLETPDYLEIQAGLARTQYEHIPMPAHATWRWTEAYGLIETDPVATQGDNWDRAWQAGNAAVERVIPAAELEQEALEAETWASQPPAQENILQTGSGWGCLEARRLAQDGSSRVGLPGVVFPESSLGAGQAPWLALLETGLFPGLAPDAAEPGAFIVDAPWRKRLEQSVAAGQADHWAGWYHLGVMRWQAGLCAEAAAAWKQSLACAPTPWAEHALGSVALFDGRVDEAAAHMGRAWNRRPADLIFARPCLEALLAAGQAPAALAVVERLSPVLRRHARIRLLEAAARLRTDRLEGVEALLRDSLPADLKEGDELLSTLWLDLLARREARLGPNPLSDDLIRRMRAQPIPLELDFRMNTGPA